MEQVLDAQLGVRVLHDTSDLTEAQAENGNSRQAEGDAHRLRIDALV